MILLCPTPVMMPTDLGRSTGNAPIPVFVTDAIDRSPSVSCEDKTGRNIQASTAPGIPPTPVVFDFGSTNVTCTASDTDGNSAECIIQVTIFGKHDPSVICDL